ncbi:MAG: IPT/TIG domain-containing protein, partial [Acidobacteria bacterium]|nr:IPT/TIG domain-containing protein [Acidobacteriota bacterium]
TVNATVTSATRSELIVTVPTGAVTGNVTVQTAAGTSNGVAFTLSGGQPPTIADFNPKTGPIGTLVTITGSNLMVGSTTPTVTFAGPNSTRLNAPVAFASLTEVRATVPANAVTGVIELITTAGTATTVLPFTIAPSQDFALTLAPSTMTVVQGSTATFEVMATSPQTNFTQLISLTAPGLAPGAAATFNPSQITAGGKSTLTIKLSPVISPTSYNFTVQGVAKVDGSDLTKTTSGSFTVMASGSTTLAGRVLSTDAVAIPGCTVSAPSPGGSNVTATTDAAGNFLLIGLQAGPARPIFIQPPSGSVYPAIKEPADVSANQSNVVPYTFYLPAIDPLDTAINPNAATDVFSTRPGLEELKMTIPQGISLRILDANNNPTGTVTHVSITPVPIDRTPAPLPGGVRASLVYTSQPGNSCVWNTATNQCFTDDTGPKMPVTYPNLSGANPGTQVPLWAFDHNNVNWYQYGLGTVSADGKRITPNAGVGLRDFSWHFASTPTGNGGNPGDPNSCPTNRGNDPVDYSTGFKIETMTDISIGGARGGLELTRTYTSHQAIFYTGNGFADSNVFRFGVGTRDNYDLRLIGSFAANGSGYLVLPEQTPFSLVGTQTFNGGRLFSYDATLSASGVTTFTNSTTGSMLGDTIRRIDSQTLEYRSTRGFILRFEPNFNPGNLVVENYYRLKSITDRNGNTTMLTYSGANLTQVTDPVGRTLTFSYGSPNCAKCVSQVIAGKAGDPLQRITSYTYGSGRHLTKATDQLGKDYEYTYSGNNLSQVKDRRGNIVKTLTYDANGRVITQTFADGGTVRYNYTLSGDVVTGITIIDQLGRTTSKRFNAQGYVIEESDALGQVSVITRAIGTNTVSKSTGPCGCTETEKTYDNRGNVLTAKDALQQIESWQYRTFSPASSYDPLLNQVTSYTDKRNKVTGYGYDAVSPNTLTPKGNLTSVTNALNQTTNYAYDSFGRLTTITDALNHAMTMAYDANSYVSSQTDALNHATTFQYDLVGNLKNVFDPLGRETRMVYDNLNRLTEVRNPANLTGNPSFTYGYDDNSNRTSVTDANLKTWTFTYDTKNRQGTVTEPTLPASRTTRWQYDVADQLLQIIAPSGRTMRYAYDARGQQQTITDGLGNNVTFGYDNRGNLTTLKDQRNNTTAFSYDELFRLTGRRDPLGRQVTVGYDSVGNVINQTDRMGRQTTIAYDNINRPTTVSYIDATVTYQYDAAGRWTSVSDASGTITWQYDNANRVTAEITNLGTVSYGYNNANQRTTMTAADRPPANYGYDSAGRLQTISQTTGGVTELFTYGYDTLSRRTQLQRQANGVGIVTTDYEYDEISRLKRLKHTRVSTGTLHEDLQYEYNLDDEITKITSLASAPLTPQSKTATTADAANRIGQFGAANYSFNQEGQTTAKTDASGTTNYQWDARGRLTRATLPSGQAVDYGYDAVGRRTGRTASSTVTTFQYDGEDIVIDRFNSGAGNDYLNGLGLDDKLRQKDIASGSIYFLQAHLGTTSLLSNLSGVLIDQRVYEAFGESSVGVSTRYGYVGRERDELTGGMYYRARWYDPTQGRFFSEDPASYLGGINLYAYVNNNPINNSDPFGLYGGIDDLAFAGGGFVVGLLGQGISDLMSGQFSGWEDYAGAAVGGAAGGWSLLYIGPVGAGAVGGGLTNFAKQGFKNLSRKQCGFDYSSFVFDTGTGALLGYVPGRPRIPGINSGRNSYNAIYKQMVTKFENGTISNVSSQTALKMFAGRGYDQGLFMGVVPGATISSKSPAVGIINPSELECPCTVVK